MGIRQSAIGVLAVVVLLSCDDASTVQQADLLLTGGRVYSFSWDEPGVDGTPAAGAPYDESGWHPDAEAIAVRHGRIVFVGSDEEAERYRGAETQVVGLDGATALPGLVDSHVHIANLGANLERVDLFGVESEEEAVERVARWAANVPAGEWIIGWGWDEGLWADRYPDLALLSERVPDYPVLLRGLHSFAVWGNRMALDRAGIGPETVAPEAGEIRKDASGQPTGILLNTATQLIEDAIPPVTAEGLKSRVIAGAESMAASGFVAVHEAGADAQLMEALESLEEEGRLPIRVYAMLAARDEPLLRDWLERGPDSDTESMLVTRSVKAFYDGALGSRGARLLEEYSDMPGHLGVSGEEYGFDAELMAEMMGAGFQVAIHAIGDAGNRETLDFIESAYSKHPESKELRNRIEHAQVVHPDDFARFAALDIIASMEPPHAVEDKAWAEDRLGPERVKGAYAWRTLRQVGARLTFNSDLPGSDHDIFYGLHAAITRRDKEFEPRGGWYPGQNMTPEEAVRAYTVWAAYSAFQEDVSGELAPGRRADITVMDIDPLALGLEAPDELLGGAIRLTVVGGRIAYQDQD